MIVAHMLVGPDEVYLDFVMERVAAWADEIFCVLDPASGGRERQVVDQYADSYWTGPDTFLIDEADYRQTAWNYMVDSLDPSPEDWIVVIDADEVVVMSELMQKAAKSPNFHGRAIGFRTHHLWDGPYYRTDGRFRVRIEPLMFQYQGKATFTPRRSARAPSYVYALQQTNLPLSDLAHYGYFTPKQRNRKAKRDSDRGIDVTDIFSAPVLKEWKKGGLPK